MSLFARLLKTFRGLRQGPLAAALLWQGRCMSPFRRFESAVCQPQTLQTFSAAGSAVGQAPNPFPGPLAVGQAPNPVPGPLAAHSCAAALPATAGACHSLGVSKAPFASPQTLQTLLGITRQLLFLTTMFSRELILSLVVAGAVLSAASPVWKCDFGGRRKDS